MPDFKGIMKFNHSTGHGWSEVWYLNAGAHPAALTQLDGLAEVRHKLLARNTRIVGLSVSDVTLPGDSWVKYPNYSPTSEKACDNVWSAIGCKALATPLHQRHVAMRGHPDEWMEFGPNGNAILEANVQSIISQLREKLVDTTFRMRVISKEAADSAPRDVTAYAPIDGSAYTRLTVADVTGVLKGANIRLVGWTSDITDDARLANGPWKVLKVEAGSIDVNLPYGQILDPTRLAPLAYKPQIIKYLPITNFNWWGQAHRDTGRAFFVSRGRQRVRQKCRFISAGSP